jgi:hypothetical protein
MITWPPLSGSDVPVVGVFPTVSRSECGSLLDLNSGGEFTSRLPAGEPLCDMHKGNVWVKIYGKDAASFLCERVDRYPLPEIH